MKRDPIDKTEAEAANRDPITGAPGSHPVGVGAGAAGGGVTGGLIGAVGGPVGAAVGAAVGAVAGGLAGKAVAEEIDPTVEQEYWSRTYVTRPYYDSAANFDTDYLPAYRMGWECGVRYRDRSFDDASREMETEWSSRRGRSSLSWERAKHAVRDAWDRVTGRRR